MDTSLTLIVIMAVLFACGVYAMLERSLTRVLIGFLLLGNAVNLLLLIVMGVPSKAPFYGVDGDISDPLPQALTLTAIVITFAVSAFLLALIYRSWQLGQADTVADDEADIALRERSDAEEDLMDDEAESGDDEATTDFVGVQTAPITVLHMRDHPAIVDDAPVDRAYPVSGAEADDADSDADAGDESDGDADAFADGEADSDDDASRRESARGRESGADPDVVAAPAYGDTDAQARADGTFGGRAAEGRADAGRDDDARGAADAPDEGDPAADEEAREETVDGGSPVLTAESAPPDDEDDVHEVDDTEEASARRDADDPGVLRTAADTHADDVDDTDAAEAHADLAGATAKPAGADGPSDTAQRPTDRPDETDEEENR